MQGRVIIFIGLVDVGSKILNKTSDRMDHAIIRSLAQRFRAAHTDALLSPPPQLGYITPGTRMYDHCLSHYRSRGGARASTAAIAAAASGCGRVGADGAGWVRRSKISQHVIEVIIGSTAYYVALVPLALAFTSIIAFTSLVLFQYSEQKSKMVVGS
jgi:hypothetical protein